jgi:hypothetical protein
MDLGEVCREKEVRFAIRDNGPASRMMFLFAPGREVL